MQSNQRRVLSLLVFTALSLSGCSSADKDGLVVHAVESAQAAIFHADPVPTDEPVLEPVCPDGAAGEGCLTKQALEVPRPIESDQERCGEVKGRIEHRSYPGALSGDPIPVIVYLPPCYDPYLQIYPVLFLLHGKPQDERLWLLLGLDAIVEQGLQEGAWPPFIMVMPNQPEPLFTHSDGGPASLEQELMQGLIPFILDRYAITGEGEGWAIAGISRGGVWALEIGFQHADQFHSVAALSPALNVNSARPAYDPLYMLTEATLTPEMIFLGAGERDSARASTLALAEVVDDLGLRYQYLEVPGNHESATWIKLLPDMLSSLTRNW